MAQQKEGVSRSHPCEICGRTDGDFRLILDNGYTLHWCFREDEERITFGGNTFIRTGHKQTSIAYYSIYMLESEYDAQRSEQKEQWLRDHRVKKGVRRADDEGWWQQYGVVSKEGLQKPAIPKRVVYEQAKEEIADADRLNEVYRTFLSLLEVEEKHRQKLAKEWGEATEEMMSKWMIKSIPPVDYHRIRSRERYVNILRKQIMQRLLLEVGEPKFVPGFYQTGKGSWTFSGMSGIAYPIFDLSNRIIRIRVCDDYPDYDGKWEDRAGTFHHQWEEGIHKWTFIDKESKDAIVLPAGISPSGKAKNKYKNFSSYSERKNEETKMIENALKFGARAPARAGIYFSEGDSFEVVNATEGEKKSIVANRIMHRPTIALPGVGTWSVLFRPESDLGGKSFFDILVEKGMKKLVVMYDADKNENERVMRAESDFIENLKMRSVKVFVGEWNEVWGKGLDDILIQGVIPVEIEVKV